MRQTQGKGKPYRGGPGYRGKKGGKKRSKKPKSVKGNYKLTTKNHTSRTASHPKKSTRPKKKKPGKSTIARFGNLKTGRKKGKRIPNKVKR